jgi:hypothetical protein
MSFGSKSCKQTELKNYAIKISKLHTLNIINQYK